MSQYSFSTTKHDTTEKLTLKATHRNLSRSSYGDYILILKSILVIKVSSR